MAGRQKRSASRNVAAQAPRLATTANHIAKNMVLLVLLKLHSPVGLLTTAMVIVGSHGSCVCGFGAVICYHSSLFGRYLDYMYIDQR